MRSMTCSTLAALVLVAPVFAGGGGGEGGDDQKRRSTSVGSVAYSGAELSGRVESVLDTLDWHSNIRSANSAAREAGKPILWIQALGEIDSFT